MLCHYQHLSERIIIYGYLDNGVDVDNLGILTADEVFSLVIGDIVNLVVIVDFVDSSESSDFYGIRVRNIIADIVYAIDIVNLRGLVQI